MTDAAGAGDGGLSATRLRAGVMDSQRPGRIVELPVTSLSGSSRLWRAARRFGLVAVAGLLVLPVPGLHLCGLAIAVVAAPLAGLSALPGRAVIGAGEIACPKCDAALPVPGGLVGWPARLQCAACKSQVELTPPEAA
jgi:hypothetical protein